MRFGQKVLRMTWKERLVQFSWKAHPFCENFRPVWLFWELWRSKRRFGQNVLRMTWKQRFVQFSWKAHCFSILKRLWGEFPDFENFDARKCDLAKTCCAWPETSVLYNFHGKRTVFPFWGQFQASLTILRTLTLKNAIRRKRAALTWNNRFVQFSWKAHCFAVLKRIWGQCDDFKNFDAQKCDLAKTCCAWPEKSVLYNFNGKRTVFPFWRDFQASVKILRTSMLKNTIWAKPPAHELKRAFCTIFMESALFSLFGENFRPVWRFWELWRLKMQFGQNVLRMTGKERLVEFSWKANCFPVLERIWGQRDDFHNFDPHKCDLAKTCCAWPEKSVLYNFHEKRTLFPFLREFQASVTILRTLTLKHAIWPKRVAHDLKTAFCPIFMESALFFRFEETLRRVSRFWELWCSKMRFGQNVLRMTWNERFVQLSWKAHCFPVLRTISGQFDDFENFDAQKCDSAKTWCADLKRSFCTIFMESALFCRFEKNLRPVWRF